MTVTGSNTAVIRQTRRRFNYQTGKSQLIIITGNFGVYDRSNMIVRLGYFDESNGLWFGYTGSSFGVGTRYNGMDTFISQSNWNLDRLDGAGKSGRYLNHTASQIYFSDFEWLGVGRVRYGIYQGGTPIYVHEITNINSLNEITPVYMATPNLPVRYEIINSGSHSGSLIQICASVGSEGGVDNTGTLRVTDTGLGSVTVNSNIITPILAIRLKTGSFGTTVKPVGVSTFCVNTHKYTLHLNPSTSSNFNWINIPNSSVEFATGSGGTTQTSSAANEGIKLMSGYVSTVQDSIITTADTELALGVDVDGTRDVLILSIVNTGGPTTAQATLSWRESV